MQLDISIYKIILCHEKYQIKVSMQLNMYNQLL